jgi:hypothetical protein
MLRFGMPLYLFKQIVKRFIAAWYDDKDAFQNRSSHTPLEGSLYLWSIDAKKLIEELKREQKIEEGDDIEEERTLEQHELSTELKKLEIFLKGGATGGAVGSHRRLVLTQTLADIWLIFFCLFDFPFKKPIYVFRKAKYLSWLFQCIIVIIYQLVELNYVKRDLNYLNGYRYNHKLDSQTASRLRERIKELDAEYIQRIFSLFRHLIDIVMVLRFIGVSYVPAKLASFIGMTSSLMSIYTLIKY